MILTVADFKAALNLPHFDPVPAHKRMAPMPRSLRRPRSRPGQPRYGGVLFLLYPLQDEWTVLFIKRPDSLSAHPGQVAFPGGRQEGDETLSQTALRETFEEVGIEPHLISLLGSLAPMYIPPSDFEVHPWVAWCSQQPTFTLQPAEVAGLFEIPLAHLLDPNTSQVTDWIINKQAMRIPYYQINGDKIWGATAMMVSEFLARLQRVTRHRAPP